MTAAARSIAILSDDEANRQRSLWRAAQDRRRSREKAKESVFGLSLNPDLVAAAILAKYPDIDSAKLASRNICEGALALIVTQELVSIVRSSAEPVLRERELMAAIKRKDFSHA
ncbi:hypothetical protein EOA13_21250 [Mesorhizobium sp. M7A.F.Ca.US.011.01.1.1]|uniref:hypothetical protein n=1 Tax=Mesorhizobium sp. M7A.F.Ca.US.011.01.1.1 TaxID=2496741 RepID=UPI000FCC86DB|nr:hypothetical protein [Mesorhizobium sp. M7A.F.Ca.US.011.01.1.1]RUX27244.1 hypothetical protein EOA13_21250 [Mesorhizobium sp. M7A.F.Ca.US.011.01.1.1]